MSAVWIKRLALLGCLLILALIVVIPLRAPSLRQAAAWHRHVSPGRLSAAHAFLENNCAACHASGGVEAASCTTCHANNQSLLQRQPTAFHADIGSCRECHLEHRGIEARPTEMDHAALTRIGSRQLAASETASGKTSYSRQQLARWINEARTGDQRPYGYAGVTAEEAILRCATCHAAQDRHWAFFGSDCAECHSTAKWTIPQFQHPPPSSPDCAQCHQAPPSHYMGHFHMVSMKVAGQPHAQVSQCYLCHQTTHWNDIRGVGRYKHH